jgi:threonine/homoserine/homoserine lactone efflux protein
MDYEILAGFLAGMIVLSATPGPGVFASMSKAVSDGFKSSLFFIGGLVIGDSVFLILAIVGMSAISKILGEMFFVIKIAGGIYLIFLGIKTFRKNNFNLNFKTGLKKNNLQTILSGLLITLGNPKPILFYASVLPTIINFSKINSVDILIMILLIALVSFAVLGSYCYFASLSRKLFIKEKSNKRINRAAGAIMSATGVYIVLK